MRVTQVAADAEGDAEVRVRVRVRVVRMRVRVRVREDAGGGLLASQPPCEYICACACACICTDQILVLIVLLSRASQSVASTRYEVPRVGKWERSPSSTVGIE